jgi:hypothetical protein
MPEKTYREALREAMSEEQLADAARQVLYLEVV